MYTESAPEGYATSTLTTYSFFGGAYEVQDDGSTETVLKYYSFAGGMVAMHEGTNLKYFLTDHLSSVIAVLDASGNLLSEQRYLPFGQVRDDDVDTIDETDFGYTSQRANTYIKLYDYRSRWYDPLLGRFTQPDTIIPSLNNPQSLNRYSYVTNRPINFNDPSGHVMCDEEGNCADHGKWVEFGSKKSELKLRYGVQLEGDWKSDQIDAAYFAVFYTAFRMAKTTAADDDPAQAFRNTYEITNSDPMIILAGKGGNDDLTEQCSNISTGACTSTSHLINFMELSSGTLGRMNNLIHELGHAFFSGRSPGVFARLQRPANGEGGVLHERPEGDPLYSTDQFYGYSGGWGKWQFGNNSTNWQGEELADMFVGWVHRSFSDAGLGPDRRQFMDDRMPLLVNRAP